MFHHQVSYKCIWDVVRRPTKLYSMGFPRVVLRSRYNCLTSVAVGVERLYKMDKDDKFFRTYVTESIVSNYEKLVRPVLTINVNT